MLPWVFISLTSTVGLLTAASVFGQPIVQFINHVDCCLDTFGNSSHGDLNGLTGVAMLGAYDVDLARGVLDRDDMTIEFCSGACAMGRFRYFGLRDGSECVCGSTVQRIPPCNGGGCDVKKCAGNNSQSCGGTKKISLHENIYTSANGSYKSMASTEIALITVLEMLVRRVYWSQEATVAFECLAACHRSPDCLACAFVRSSRMCRLMRFAAVPSEVASEAQWVWVKL
uniref:WSC domain-containing protein n=1 Tax=Macrostomum lignano TaxID=282301 RepID=A0A1I8IH79_9PLAT